MARANEARQSDEDIYKEFRETLKKYGVNHVADEHGGPGTTPSPERESYTERAKVKDLTQEQKAMPEGVRTTELSWVDKVRRPRGDQAQEQQATQSWAERVKPSMAKDAETGREGEQGKEQNVVALQRGGQSRGHELER